MVVAEAQGSSQAFMNHKRPPFPATALVDRTHRSHPTPSVITTNGSSYPRSSPTPLQCSTSPLPHSNAQAPSPHPEEQTQQPSTPRSQRQTEAPKPATLRRRPRYNTTPTGTWPCLAPPHRRSATTPAPLAHQLTNQSPHPQGPQHPPSPIKAKKDTEVPEDEPTDQLPDEPCVVLAGDNR
ncbi:hypothetical protein BDK51DRAFT_44307 [Blyttiomyces helicus]|uniref:Uncharacterized protein n=1 Tax=Blyttiomyces helicus TaxID=388810 RepID=A0A4P9WKT9_9FUNG|nr:hypothetical protein BDK51DRAFT_44307 [Blyttiomyces helicus]|eukprot:RKO93621.1 hypothetical protein BDK51DRAFT_44307 [Blyttiomyces helicus]